MRSEHTGFTLIENMIVVLIAAILLAIAVPAWRSATSAAHNSAARSTLAGTLVDAVSRSAATGIDVVVCPHADATRCSGDTDWSGGWMVFGDRNGNRSREPDEPIVRQVGALAGGVKLRSTAGRTLVVFQPNGGNAGSNVTFTLCDRRGVGNASTLVLANDGRLRQGRPSVNAAQTCVAGT